MQNHHPTQDQLVAALTLLIDKWAALAKEIRERSHHRLPGGMPPEYTNGVSHGLETAANDLRKLLDETASRSADQTEPQRYAAVSREQAQKVLDRAGLSVTALYEDRDYSFSAVFPKMPPTSFDERIARLQAASGGTLIVIEYGTVTSSGNPFIDFGFSAPPPQ